MNTETKRPFPYLPTLRRALEGGNGLENKTDSIQQAGPDSPKEQKEKLSESHEPCYSSVKKSLDYNI